jgi:hypothetical protein
VDKEINTDDIEKADVCNQFPEDIGTDYWKLRREQNEFGEISEYAKK